MAREFGFLFFVDFGSTMEQIKCEFKSCTIFDYNLVIIGRLRIDPRYLRTGRRRNDSFAKRPVTDTKTQYNIAQCYVTVSVF